MRDTDTLDVIEFNAVADRDCLTDAVTDDEIVSVEEVETEPVTLKDCFAVVEPVGVRVGLLELKALDDTVEDGL